MKPRSYSRPLMLIYLIFLLVDNATTFAQAQNTGCPCFQRFSLSAGRFVHRATLFTIDELLPAGISDFKSNIEVKNNWAFVGTFDFMFPVPGTSGIIKDISVGFNLNLIFSPNSDLLAISEDEHEFKVGSLNYIAITVGFPVFEYKSIYFVVASPGVSIISIKNTSNSSNDKSAEFGYSLFTIGLNIPHRSCVALRLNCMLFKSVDKFSDLFVFVSKEKTSDLLLSAGLSVRF